MPLSESSAYDPLSPNSAPVSMGPGAHPISKGSRPTAEDSIAIIKELADVRSKYFLNVDRNASPPILEIGYELRNRTQNYKLSISDLPLNNATSWLLYGGDKRAAVTGTFVIDTVRGAENMVGRPLSASEVEGLALHASRRMLYTFAANFSALMIGASLAFVGRKTMKFPFRKPQPLERYNNFPNRYLPILKGDFARATWHITRMNIYTLIAIMLLNPLYISMGDSAMMVGLYKDVRTNGVMNGIKARGGRLGRLSSNSGSETRGGQIPQQPVQSQGQDRYSDPDPEGYYNDTEAAVRNDYNGGRDYNGGTDNPTNYADGTADSGEMGDSTMQQSDYKQSLPSSPRRQPFDRRQPTPNPPRYPSNTNSGDFLDDLDDASPTAGSEPLNPINAYPDPNSGVSAWDRVRRTRSGPTAPGNTKGITPPGMRHRPGPAAQSLQQQEQDAQGESFSYESADAERQLAKNNAQKEFDEMLERERRGSRDREVGSTFGNQGQGSDGGGGGGESAWERRRGS